MRLPGAFRHPHLRKDRREAGVLRAAGVDAEADRPRALPHMADAHLGKALSVFGALDAIVVLPAAEAVPHLLHVGRDRRRRPVRIAVVGDHGAEMLELFVLVLDRRLEPVFAVEVHHDAALVKAVMTAGEIRFYDKGEILLFGFPLQHRRIVVSEVIIGPLPQVGMRLGLDGDFFVGNAGFLRLSGPLEAFRFALPGLPALPAGKRRPCLRQVMLRRIPPCSVPALNRFYHNDLLPCFSRQHSLFYSLYHRPRRMATDPAAAVAISRRALYNRVRKSRRKEHRRIGEDA